MNVSKELVIKQGRLVYQGSLKKLKRKKPVSAMVCVAIIALIHFFLITKVINKVFNNSRVNYESSQLACSDSVHLPSMIQFSHFLAICELLVTIEKSLTRVLFSLPFWFNNC